MGIVGESGSGKSVQAYSLLGLVPPPGRVLGGRIAFEGRDVLSFGPEELARFRGGEVAMVFQNPMTSLNPLYPVGSQLVEALRAHETISRRAARERAAQMLERVGIQNPAHAHGPVSPPVLRRAAAAGDDRHGPHLPAQAAHRRRADHRPGCDHPGPDSWS